ncbi:mitochondrial ribosomal protein [Xylariomycetidae sp. FL2044]|nr:mitochondrial ribosomal protein [Xylariomycetidae sp. FL2044]
MAFTVPSLRLCLRSFRRSPIPRKAAFQARATTRTITSTSVRRQEETDPRLDDDDDEHDFARFQEVQTLTRTAQRALTDMNNTIDESQRLPKMPKSRTFWSEEEEEEELITDENDEDMFDEDDIMSIAHGKLEEYREYREYARLAAWEMPLLSKLARPFEPPTKEEPLRFRFTSYMGELHPAENKVVVEFSPRDMPLTEAQQLKLRKLLGPRLNPETDIAKMSCEQFEHQAQNKRYLGDLVDNLVAQAKDPTDMFEDVPLDTRHHTFKVKPKFPREWRMTEQRRQELEDTRQKSLLLDQTKEEAGQLVDGRAKYEAFFANPPPPTARIAKPELVRARRGPPPAGRGRPAPARRA